MKVARHEDVGHDGDADEAPEQEGGEDEHLQVVLDGAREEEPVLAHVARLIRACVAQQPLLQPAAHVCHEEGLDQHADDSADHEGPHDGRGDQPVLVALRRWPVVAQEHVLHVHDRAVAALLRRVRLTS